jgi:hypothetical protein
VAKELVTWAKAPLIIPLPLLPEIVLFVKVALLSKALTTPPVSS